MDCGAETLPRNEERSAASSYLPEAFSADPERLARFQREAEVLASLNHPNIAAIYGLEEADGTRALVLELVEGPTLADRIKQGAIPLDEALPIAKQIAEALEAAHEAGVIHRDLKPANIKVRDDGTVKVLDFGLAKALDPNPEGDPSQSPTLTAAATQMGVIMGTAAYMSPEQASGRSVDKRGDIWSFGVVLFEMLTGRRLFEGETVSHVLASVLKTDPEWEVLPAKVPEAIRRVLRRCLEKERKRRLPEISVAIMELDESRNAEVPASRVAEVQVTPSSRRPTLPWAAGILIGGIAAGLSSWVFTRPEVAAPLPPTRSAVPLPSGVRPDGLVISPDGRTIAFAGQALDASDDRIYVRPLSELDAVPLRGGQRAWPNAFSPDGNSLLITDYSQTPRMVSRIFLSGGPATPIIEDPDTAAADWGPDNMIVVGSADGLLHVPVSGGEPTLLTTTTEGEIFHNRPKFLPDGRGILFYVWTGELGAAQVAVYDFKTGERRTLLPGSSPQFSASGHLVFWRDESLWAAPLELDRLEVTSAPVPIVQEVASNAFGFADYVVSAEGTLVYLPVDQSLVARRSLVWVDRDGREQPIGMTPREYVTARLSPDGRRVVADTFGQESDLFLFDLETLVDEQFTFSRLGDDHPLWSPDGEQIIFTSQRHGGWQNLYATASNGSGTAERITTADLGFNHVGLDWASNGGILLFGGNEIWDAGSDLMTLPFLEEAEPEVLWETDFNEGLFTISPNGRWIAYVSEVSGERQVYVRPFPELSSGGERLISDGPA